MAVAPNMNAIARLENPLRLLKVWDQVLTRSERDRRKEKTNTKITTDAEKSTTKTPVIKLMDKPHTTSAEDTP